MVVATAIHELSLLKFHATKEATSKREVRKLCTTVGENGFSLPNSPAASRKSGPSGPRRNVGCGGFSRGCRSSRSLVSSVFFSRHHPAQCRHQARRCLL